MKRFAFLFAALLLVAACGREGAESAFSGRTGTKEVSFEISGDSLPALVTRSSVTAPEAALRTVDLFFYDNSRLCENMSVHRNVGGAGSCSIGVEMEMGHTYEILAVANTPGLSAPATLQEALSSLKCTADGIGGWNSTGIPMAARRSVTVTPSTSVVVLPVERLVAKVNLKVRTSLLQHGSIQFSSIAVRQMNRVCGLFSPAKAGVADGVVDGDLASPSDLEAVNADKNGYATSFYLLENLQGDLLPGNTDPDQKIPSSVSARGFNPDLCTYIEILGTYSDNSGYLTGLPLTARLFLGSDPCVNFDIVRNNQYDIDLTITDEGCLRADWKIDGNLVDKRELRFLSESTTLGTDSSVSVPLSTNLSLSRGDYSYAVTGDLTCLSVTAAADGRSFTVTSRVGAPMGSSVVIVASSWDGKLVTSHRVSVVRQIISGYNISWDESGVMYVAQRRALLVREKLSGNYPSGNVQVTSGSGAVSVWRSGTVWYVDGMMAGEDMLTVKVDGTVVGSMPVEVVAPELKFPSDRVFLPLDGAAAAVGPYYYRVDGSRLYWEDFDAELYSELLDLSARRTQDAAQRGRRWGASLSGGCPAVSNRSMSDDYYSFAFYISRLSYNGVAISDNYDFSLGEVELERITAYPADEGCGVAPVSAVLYTSDPFRGSRHLGSRASWALARWRKERVHDELFYFSYPDMVLPGNDYSSASAVYTFSPEGKFSFTFTSSSTVEMKILYGSNVETAMPEHYFSLAPTMSNRHSGEVYVSEARYTVDFTVNLSLGAVARDNNAGGCDVSVEWAFPRLDDGRLDFFEPYGVAGIGSGGGYVKGMYRRLYSAYGYSPDAYMEMEIPNYRFADIAYAPGAVVPLETDTYHLPESYSEGYDIIVWKYSALYPESGGWLEK